MGRGGFSVLIIKLGTNNYVSLAFQKMNNVYNSNLTMKHQLLLLAL